GGHRDRSNRSLDTLHLRFHALAAGLNFRLLCELDIRRQHIELATFRLLDIARHDSLCLGVEIGAQANLLDALLLAFFGIGKRFLRLLFCVLFPGRSLFDEGSGLRLDALERAVASPPSPEADERFVTGKYVNAVQEKV